MKVNAKNKVMCPGCGKPKMQFETEKKAQDFIKWNADEFSQDNQMPRVYYCDACCCWHISTKPFSSGYGSQLKNKIKTFEQQRGNSGVRIDKLIRGAGLEPAIRQAQEIYPQLSNGNFSYQPRSAVRTIIHNFLKEHKEYQDSPALRSEILHIYHKESRKIKKK